MSKGGEAHKSGGAEKRDAKGVSPRNTMVLHDEVSNKQMDGLTDGREMGRRGMSALPVWHGSECRGCMHLLSSLRCRKSLLLHIF